MVIFCPSLTVQVTVVGGEPVEMHVRVEDEDSDLKTTLVMLIVAAYRD